jgi:EAL domain-containing protein (putative c-di-GMP-specific phosphodiesterase class I)
MLATGTEANLAMFRLPENGANISCSLARPGPRAGLKPDMDPKTGLASRDSFMAAAQKAGNYDTMTLVDVPGLPELCAQLSPDSADQLMARIGASMQTAGASAMGRVSETGFGALSPSTRGPLGLAAKVIEAIKAGGLTPPKVSESQVSLAAANLSPEQKLLSLRYVIERFTTKGKVEGDIATAFNGMVDETQLRLTEMMRRLGDGAFEIAYQPISDLKTAKVSHYEALARFNNPQGTGDTVKFIEALGIANAFDLAVAHKVMSLMDRIPGTHVAFNVSGATIASPASFGMLAAMLARRRALAPRTLIEITETAAITDLENAGKAVSALRAMGYRVGLDDFGAGAASINYLHAFAVDFVKFDGALIQKMGQAKRDDALLAGLVKLCAEMGVTTIAEWIETEAMAKAASAMGFDHGQGKWLGAPALELPVTSSAPTGRRKGVQESWG